MPKIDIATVPNARAPAIRRRSTRRLLTACASGSAMPAGSPISGSISCACRRATGRASATGIRHEDEFVYVLEGELTLIEDDGETLLRAGDCAAFPKSTGNGHHLINKSDAMAVYLEVGSRHPKTSPPVPTST